MNTDARPKLKSDDEVLEAATVVLKRCGPIEFTLSGVAKEVGLSRAALIQRFTNRDTLLVRMMERGVEQVRHYLNAIPIGAGPQGLWEFLQVLVRSMNTRNDFSVNYLISWYELQVPELRTLAIQRNRAVVEGIRKRLPPGAPAAAELLLHSVIAGATMQWAVDPDGELADHVLAQIAAILCLMFPEHDDFQLLQAHA
ncbi:TetR/AcrR family transcriptional regulator [Klebsiella pneumoniae]|nr:MULTISPECIES: macrolide-binding transcriptional repressor MphR(A) [Enterobacteriaceae]OCW45163.1 macrolide 2'-phosphotransferase [Aeromonas caviae]AXO58937.1 TetR/AcrR family transcriptional regulator [Klebsiella pneumoniae]MCT2856711.1 TetR/AcrR family transcriptional regulator [Klebsiella pneumoniae]NGQ27547.1 TetR/AcrR family transcriptional regulator [Klebsiella pneumoniae]OFE16251.1 macrolide 2'-phosphotransferase [Escherichia coli]